MNNSRELETYNTTEVREFAYETVLDRFVRDTKRNANDGLPVHISLIRTRVDLSPMQKRAMAASYSSGAIHKVGDYLNTCVTILGACIYEHGPYLDKSTGEEKSGYNKMLLKTDKASIQKVVDGEKVIKVRMPIIIATSAQSVIDFFLGICSTDHWYDFSAPVKCFFTGTQSTGYKVQEIADERLSATIESIAQQYKVTEEKE